MPNQYTAIAPALSHQVRKSWGRSLLDQGKTYNEIRRITGLSPSTISGLRKGDVEYNSSLAEAIQKTETDELRIIGAVARDRILSDLQSSKTNPIATIAAMDRAFQQRRTLEGQASGIFDINRIEMSSKQIEDRLSSLDADEVKLTKGRNGKYAKR